MDCLVPPPLLLALDAAGLRCSATLARGAEIIATVERAGPSGEAAFLPAMVAELLEGAGLSPPAIAAVAVDIGPGSFTGLRASIAFATGFAAGASVPVIAVTLAEALAFTLDTQASDPAIWCALDARQGRLFLHQGGEPEDWAVVRLDDPPLPEAPVRLTGDAAAALGEALAARGEALAARGVAAEITPAIAPHARGVAAAALARLGGQLPPLALQPLYIDPPRALPPRGGLRPPPTAPEAP